jgi:hypothetical protein
MDYSSCAFQPPFVILERVIVWATHTAAISERVSGVCSATNLNALYLLDLYNLACLLSEGASCQTLRRVYVQNHHLPSEYYIDRGMNEFKIP